MKNTNSPSPEAGYDGRQDNRHQEFLRLLVQNQRRIWAFILCMVNNRSDADDILQETLIDLWNRFDTYQSGTDFVAWGIAAAKFKVLKHRQKSGRSKLQFSSDLLEALEREAPLILNYMEDYLDALHGCRQKLSSRGQQIIEMRYEEDLTFAKIGERLGMSMQAAHKIMAQVHARLVRCMRLTMGLSGEAHV